MKRIFIKTFENFKTDNITIDDIIDVIKNSGTIMVSHIKDLPNHDMSEYVKPIDISETDITVEIDGDMYYTDLKFVEKIQFGN